MPTYLGFLRAINLGAHRKFPKEAIRGAVTAAGFGDVETYINTGNIRFSTTLRSRAKIERALEEAFLEDRGFDVPTIVFTPRELTAIATDATDLRAGFPDLARQYVYLLKDEPSPEARAALAAAGPGPDRLVPVGRAVHALLTEAYSGTSVDSLATTRMLGVATNRNYNVIATLADRWGSAPAR